MLRFTHHEQFKFFKFIVCNFPCKVLVEDPTQDPRWDPEWDPGWDFGTGSRLVSQVGSRAGLENPSILKFPNQSCYTRDPRQDNLVSRLGKCAIPRVGKSAIPGGINWHPRWDKLVSQVE